MAGYNWQKIDIDTIQNPPHFLETEDYCCYAREYTVDASYTESETNQLIKNFKKTVDRKGKREWYYKSVAIERFAKELSCLLDGSYTVTCVPSSKTKDDPLYDSRLEDTLALLKQYNNRIYIEFPIIRHTSVLAKHEGGARHPAIERQSLKWVGFKKKHSHIIIIDDMITSGASFKACEQIILENAPDIEIIGVFWTRAINKNI